MDALELVISKIGEATTIDADKEYIIAHKLELSEADIKDQNFAYSVYLTFNNYSVLILHSGLKRYFVGNSTERKISTEHFVPAASTRVFYNERFLKHFVGLLGKSVSFHNNNVNKLHDLIFGYINSFTPFAVADVRIIVQFIKRVANDPTCVLTKDQTPCIQITPSFGAYHDRTQSTIIKRCINLIFKALDIDVRVYASKFVKQKASFKEDVGGGCSTCGPVYETRYERILSYSKEQASTRMLLFAAPKNSVNHNYVHQTLLGQYRPLVNDARQTIELIAPNGRTIPFIDAHDQCKKLFPTIILQLIGSISISRIMAIAAIDHQYLFRGDHGKTQSAKLRLYCV
jgi:hypothetical protein